MINYERLKEVQAVQLDILFYLDQVCKENNIEYYLFYGTLLGAVRHKGMIPWDDDVDVVMKRDDYIRFISAFGKLPGTRYFIQTPESDPDCFYGGYCKLRDSYTTAIELRNWGHRCNQGIWVDIFPLDFLEEDYSKRQGQFEQIREFQRLLTAQVYGNDFEAYMGLTTEQWSIYKKLSNYVDHSWICGRLEEAFTLCNEKGSGYVSVLARFLDETKLRFFHKSYFEKADFMEFHGKILPVPIGWKQCLETIYGLDFMEYPDEDKQIPKHRAFYAPQTQYNLYTKRLFDIGKEIQGKSVVIFGAGLMFEDFLRKTEDRFKPEYLVDNNSAKWGTLKNGYMIKPPYELQSMPKEKLYLIICNIYYREIEKQLLDMGISDYYIYAQERAWLVEDPER